MALNSKQQELLDRFVEKVCTAAKVDLESIVLYGTSAGGDFHANYSDLNVLCLFKQINAQTLDSLAPVMRWWSESKQPQPYLFEVSELHASTDVFAIEFLDIKSRYRVLFGDDLISDLQVPMDLHRVQLEHELRTNLMRLRHHYLAATGDNKKIMELMAGSISSFTTLFRHALIALGEKPAEHRREAVERLAVLLQFDAAPLLAILDIRAGKIQPSNVNMVGIFQGFLAAVERVTEEVDRRLAH